MAQLVAGIGEYKVSDSEQDQVKTYALGSCVAVIAYDKVKRAGGLIHIALPESTVDPDKAARSPGHFADTGLPYFFEELKKAGLTRANTWIKLAGGAKVMDPNSFFDIGRRNILAIKKHLWQMGLGPIAEDVGGDFSRTVTLDLSDGSVLLSSADKKWNI